MNKEEILKGMKETDDLIRSEVRGNTLLISGVVLGIVGSFLAAMILDFVKIIFPLPVRVGIFIMLLIVFFFTINAIKKENESRIDIRKKLAHTMYVIKQK